jgi:hypothetical protein
LKIENQQESVERSLLKRHYKNVCHDVQALARVGLIERTAEKLLSVPWKKVVAEIRLAA